MRVTGGIHRSRALRAPRGDATRPTSDRVREALFSILGASRAIEGSRVLDLYAGTGALAIEALSRGASSAVLIEKSRDALASIRDNVRQLGLERQVRVVATGVDRAVDALAREAPFDVVFADPPYAIAAADTKEGAPAVLGALVAAGLLAKGGVVVLEHAAKTEAPAITRLHLEGTRRYGDTSLSFYVEPPIT